MPSKILIVLWLSALALVPLHLAQAQQPKKVARVGYLSLRFPPSPSTPLHPNDEAFYQGLREVGYTVYMNLVVEHRYAEGNGKGFAKFATEFVSSKVDLIVAPSTPAILAARKATTTITVVMLSVVDPVSAEFIPSLSRPGGNITGVTGNVADLSGKLLQLLVDAVPG